LKATAGNAIALEEAARPRKTRSLQPIWVGLCVLMILTPLGILATGTAWGEWMASDFASPSAREQIAASSLHQASPAVAPQGLEQMSQLWTAPFSRYAPPYIRSAGFGYFLSAMFGVGLVMLVCFLVVRMMRGFVVGQPRQPAL
jgi:cobalt/nickel transport system permease protein